ncbi:hypothetical protein [Vibrio sp. 10N.222.55.A1]|uniref:hypothetical protein n=1 Tax=Vibrio sp. 10N.222.55.A1 TaxID=3229646 RepID=UPI00354F203A
MITILFGYMCGASLVGFGLLWTMAKKLDEYDWRYNKAGIWLSFTVIVVFWPIVSLRWLLQGRPCLGKWMNPEPNYAARQREAVQVRLRVQQCGAYVRFLPNPVGICEESYGEFTFPSEFIERILIEKLHENPHLQYSDEGELLAWIQGRDDALRESVDVPTIWPRFVYLIDTLIEKNIGKVICRVCGDEMEVGRLQGKSSMTGGHSQESYHCSNGHTLVAYEGVRLILSTR